MAGRKISGSKEFERDQKNCKLEIKVKHQKEEEVQEEAAKNQKLVAELSVKLTTTLDKFSAAFVSIFGNDNGIIGD